VSEGSRQVARQRRDLLDGLVQQIAPVVGCHLADVLRRERDALLEAVEGGVSGEVAAA
jgi:hypothetical protein